MIRWMVRPIEQQIGRLAGQLWRNFHIPCFCVVMTKDSPVERAVLKLVQLVGAACWHKSRRICRSQHRSNSGTSLNRSG